LRACGCSGPAVRRIALAEGAVVCGVGAVAGLLAAPLVSVVFLEGLRWRLALAMRPPRLELHIEPSSLALGLVFTLVAAFASTMAATRRISRATVMDLLGGRVRKDRRPAGGARRRLLGLAGLILLGLAAGLIAAAETSPALASRSGPALFFGAGASILAGGILLLAAFLSSGMRSPAARTPRAPGAWMALLWLGLRNLKRHPGRSFLTVALMAFASFVIAAAGILGSGGGPETGRDSGTGGFAFAAATDIPLVRSLSDPAVRDDLGIPGSVDGKPVSWDGVEIAALRREDGSDASCLNLYRSARPPILGAPPEFIRRGGFRFKASLAQTTAERDNPWLLLRRGSPEAAGGGPIPAVADEATALWSLHLGLGGDLEVPDGRGGKARLRLVGLLGGSILQGSLIISEESLLALYPRSAGRRFFLVGAPPGEAERIVRALSEGLAPFGFDPVTTERLLEGYRSVERAYLDTFLALGGLGLILGAAGLGAVLLRGILERRGELALLRALGWSRGMLSALVLAENSILVAAGLGLGTLAALASALPHLASDTAPLLPLALTLAGAAAVGLGSGLFAVRTAVRAGIVEALRGE